MVCNEANLDLVLSLEQKIVVSEHNELAVVTYPLGPNWLFASWCSMGKHVSGYIHEDIFNSNSGLFVQ